MNERSLDEDRLNLEIRKFLKVVGITSQREIEKAIRAAVESGTLPEAGGLACKVTLAVPAIGLEHVVDHEIELR